MQKIVLITGASGDLGKSIALQLNKDGYVLALNYNSNEIDYLNQLNDYILVKADLNKEDEIINMIDTVISKYSKIDVLINNAGLAIDTLFEDKTAENFKKILNINLIAPFLLSKYVSKYMNNGKIINIASTNGVDTYYPESMDYDASKAGLINLTYNLATQLAPNIIVNAVAPGWINTKMNKELDEEYINKENKKILLNRFADPNEIANVVSFLVSDKSSYINGTVIRVDGGKKC